MVFRLLRAQWRPADRTREPHATVQFLLGFINYHASSELSFCLLTLWALDCVLVLCIIIDHWTSYIAEDLWTTFCYKIYQQDDRIMLFVSLCMASV